MDGKHLSKGNLILIYKDEIWKQSESIKIFREKHLNDLIKKSAL